MNESLYFLCILFKQKVFGMQNYYFADSHLRITGDDNLFQGSRLSNYETLLPYGEKIYLNISANPCETYEDIQFISEGAGIRIGKTGKGKWFFCGTDKNNGCCVEANQDYSLLQGCLDLKQCSDVDILKENFFQLLRVAIECHLAYHNGVSVHASCICTNGKAVLFTAPSGTGKSTQAAIWAEYLGARILSGDRPFVRLSKEGVRAYGVPWDGKERLFLEEDYPVAAIVEVRRAERNGLRRLSAGQAFRLLMTQSFIPMWDDAAKFSVMKSLRMIAGKVPFYRLFCTPKEDSAYLLNNVLFNGKETSLEEECVDMKIKEGYILKNIVDEWIVLPSGGKDASFEGAIVLNDVAAFIWRQLEKPISRDDILQAVVDEYDIGEQKAAQDLDNLLNKLRGLKILHES